MSETQSVSTDLSEPYLNYIRLQNDIEKQSESDTYTCICIHERYVAIGTNSGRVLLFNNKDKLFKIFAMHMGRINAISIDKSGETFGTAGEDGNVYIQLMAENSKIPHKYSTAIRALRLDPTSKEKMFVCGGLKGQLIMNKKSWFAYQDVVIHESEGPISTISYSYPFIAWCNEYGTKVYNIETETRVTAIDKPPAIPETSQCKPKLCWYGNSRLCIGWGDTLTSVQLKYKSTAAGNRVWYGETAATVRLEYWICGMGIYNDAHLTVLAYYPPQGDTVEPPSIHVVNIADGSSLSEECLPVRGYEGFTAVDYTLEANCTSPSSTPLPLYLLSPTSVVRITPRSVQDHVDWAVEREDFEQALCIMTDRANGFSAERISNMREQYLEHLFATNDIDKAASLCPLYLGKDASLWERWIARFNGLGKLLLLLPYIPLSEPRLPLPVYTLVLNYFLYNDIGAFLALLRSWPKPTGDAASDLYDPRMLLQLMKAMQSNKHDTAVQEALAELCAMTGDYEQAVKTYLDGNVVNVENSPFFDWVESHELLPLVKSRVLQLFRLSSKNAASLLVQHMTEVTPQSVVKQLTTEPAFQQEYLHISFHVLFCRRTSEYNTEAFKALHALQLDLLIQFNSPDLLFFLETSQEYDVPTALNRCLQAPQPRTREAVYLYSRLGDTSRALQMIVQDLGDVDMALEFVQKWKDRDLWDDLVKYSVVKPSFVGALLDRAGEYINAITLIKCIPDGMTVPQLKEKLVHVMDNYSLELELRQGCNTILTSDMAELYERLVKSKMTGIRLDPSALCSICQQDLFQVRKATRTCPPPQVVAFHCSHLYHRSCLEHVCGRFDNTAEGKKVILRCIRCESGESHDEKAKDIQESMEMEFELQEDAESD